PVMTLLTAELNSQTKNYSRVIEKPSTQPVSNIQFRWLSPLGARVTTPWAPWRRCTISSRNIMIEKLTPFLTNGRPDERREFVRHRDICKNDSLKSPLQVTIGCTRMYGMRSSSKRGT